MRLFSFLFVAALAAPANAQTGSLFTMTNDATANEVVVFARASDGSLAETYRIATGGRGSGAGLGSQGALVRTDDGLHLLAVNAGSNDLSVFAISDGLVLELREIEPSMGTMPTSVSARGDLVYVLNAGGTNNVSGFRLSNLGDLTPIAGSTTLLSAASTAPAQVEISPTGGRVVVTERATNKIDLFEIDANGKLGMRVENASTGATPFGFAYAKRGVLVVSEAFGGAPGLSAMSTYRTRDDETLSNISASVGTLQSAACWVVLTRDFRFAYTSNTGSGSITGYSMTRDGVLQRLDASGVTGSTGPGSGPLDMAFSNGDGFLYSLNSDGTLSSFAVESDGKLTALGTVVGLARGMAGLVAR